MEYEIARLTIDNRHLLPHADQPFALIGKLIPRYDGENWSVSEILFPAPREKTYPPEDYDPADYLSGQAAAFLAMTGGERVGSIRLCRRWNGNAFVDDLKVDPAHRGHGVGGMLLDAAVRWAREQGLNGLSLETQDDNLLACRFYLKHGFRLGGIDRYSYTDPAYRGETALYFYLAEEIFSRA